MRVQGFRAQGVEAFGFGEKGAMVNPKLTLVSPVLAGKCALRTSTETLKSSR